MSPSKRKRVTAVIGASVVFATFLVNDAKKTHNKELADSIEAAENAFISHTDNRKTQGELRRLSEDLTDFRKNPSKPQMGGGGSSFGEPEDIDLDTFWELGASMVSQSDLTETMIRLSNKLPDAADLKTDLLSSRGKLNDMLARHKTIGDMIAKTGQKGGNKREQSAISVNQLVESEIAAQNDQLIELSGLSTRLQAIADKERERAEAHYARWNIIFYVLYILGWLITIYGIVTGASGEAAIEKVAEEL